uniref:Mitochondrial carrier protein n=1 Tax=Clastoptera arizonana TaxID=38151 RepID=A0A1B6E077_9HEMI
MATATSETHPKASTSWWKHLLAGTIAGIASRSFIAPIDVLKTFYQVRATKDTKIMDTFNTLYSEGGMRGLWRGNRANGLKAGLSTGMKFMAFDQMMKVGRYLKDGEELNVVDRFVAGSVAVFCSQGVAYPFDVIKTRLSLVRPGVYRGVFDCARQTVVRHGFKALYKGCLINAFMMIPFAAYELAVYETLKKTYGNQDNMTLPPVFGIVASSSTLLLNYPMMLTKTRLQADPLTTHNYISMLKHTYRTGGVPELYRGFPLGFLKIVPQKAVAFLVLEVCRKAMGVY